MAHIRKLGSSYQVQIRKKTCSIHRSFDSEESAILYAAYKERLIDEIAAFEIPHEQLCLLGAAIDLKINQGKEEKLDAKSLNDLTNLKKDFIELLDVPVYDLNYNLLLEKSKNMLQTVVVKGGQPNNENSGHQRIQSPVTVLKKFRCLGSVISNLIRMGINIKNDIPNVTSYLSSLIKDHEGKHS